MPLNLWTKFGLRGYGGSAASTASSGPATTLLSEGTIFFQKFGVILRSKSALMQIIKSLKIGRFNNAQCVILVIFMNSAELRLEPPKFIVFEYYHLLIYNFFSQKVISSETGIEPGT